MLQLLLVAVVVVVVAFRRRRRRSFLGPKNPVLFQFEDPQQGAQPDHGSLVTPLQKRVHGVSGTHSGGDTLRGGEAAGEGVAEEGQEARVDGGGGRGRGWGWGGAGGVGGRFVGGWGEEEVVEVAAAETQGVEESAALTEQ